MVAEIVWINVDFAVCVHGFKKKYRLGTCGGRPIKQQIDFFDERIML